MDTPELRRVVEQSISREIYIDLDLLESGIYYLI